MKRFLLVIVLLISMSSNIKAELACGVGTLLLPIPCLFMQSDEPDVESHSTLRLKGPGQFWEPDYLQPRPEPETGFGKVFFLGGTLLAPTTEGRYTLLYGGELGFAIDYSTVLIANGYAGKPAYMNDITRAISGKDQIAESVYWFGAGVERIIADFIVIHVGASFRQAERPGTMIIFGTAIPNLPEKYKGSGESKDIGILADLGLGFHLSIADHIHLRAMGMYRPTIWGTTSGTIKSDMAIHSFTGQISVGFSLW